LKGPHTPTINVNDIEVPKPEKDWDENDMKLAELSAKAMNLLYCALDPNEFNRISTCNSAKEIRDKLEITHEGTSQVKTSKINLLVHNYELFKMDSNETISAMYTRFTDIINGLKSLGRTYTNADLVQNVLRSLPDKWEAKLIAIQQAKDLNTLPLDELLGSLIIHELAMQQRTNEDTKRKKAIAFKDIKEDKNEDSDSLDDDDLENDEIALVMRRFKRFMGRRKINRWRKQFRKGDFGRERKKDKKKEKDKDNDAGLICMQFFLYVLYVGLGD